MIKMQTKAGKWIVIYGNNARTFDNPREAWQYIFKLKTLHPGR